MTANSVCSHGAVIWHCGVCIKVIFPLPSLEVVLVHSAVALRFCTEVLDRPAGHDTRVALQHQASLDACLLVLIMLSMHLEGSFLNPTGLAFLDA